MENEEIQIEDLDNIEQNASRIRQEYMDIYPGRQVPGVYGSDTLRLVDTIRKHNQSLQAGR